MKEATKSIELRSEKVRNIIGRVPPALLRHGIAIITFTIIILISLLAVIPYQPSVKTQITVSQNKLGKMLYIGRVPGNILSSEIRNLHFEMNEYPGHVLPSAFKAQFVSDTIVVTSREAYRIVQLEPQDESRIAPIIKAKEPFLVPGKILCPTTSLLKYMLNIR